MGRLPGYTSVFHPALSLLCELDLGSLSLPSSPAFLLRLDVTKENNLNQDQTHLALGLAVLFVAQKTRSNIASFSIL